MNVEFKSIIRRDGAEDETIKFVAPVNLSTRQGFQTWEFEEPSQNIMNLIEAKDNMVTIFAGAQTIQLKLQERVSNSYQQQGMPAPVYFESFLEEMTIEGNDLSVRYTLWQGQNAFGQYNMSLKVK